jgi:thymidylate synthase (FAD)
MKITLEDHTRIPIQKIGRAAAECYDGKTDIDSNHKRAVKCKSDGHLATMRFAYATFRVAEISRVCSHQLVRIAHAGILQRSQRYVKETKVEFIVPDELLVKCPESFVQEWEAYLKQGEELYLRGLEYGMKKGNARYILPQSCTTSLWLCLNFQGWQDLLRNRTAKPADWEIKNVALEIQHQLHQLAPELF